jgi:hypothetical protein
MNKQIAIELKQESEIVAKKFSSMNREGNFNVPHQLYLKKTLVSWLLLFFIILTKDIQKDGNTTSQLIHTLLE